MTFDVHNYDDIINIKKPKSNHKTMDKLQRAAQFAPFAALTGYEESIIEAGRIVSNKKELSEEQKEVINYKLNYLLENKKDSIEIEVIYYVPDKNKKGGSYQHKIGIVRKIDDVEKKIIFIDNSFILIDEIYDIKCDLFDL